jgi:hypothetical protein
MNIANIETAGKECKPFKYVFQKQIEEDLEGLKKRISSIFAMHLALSACCAPFDSWPDKVAGREFIS